MKENKTINSVKPYLLRAIYQWCEDNQLTPHIAVYVNEHTQVPMQYVQENQIVLNIGSQASVDLNIDQEFVVFSARFAGKPMDMVIPIGHVLHIFARENGEGMGFELQEYTPENTPSPTKKTQSKPKEDASGSLKVVKRKKTTP